MRLTVVITYYNRREQLVATLKSIELTKCDDFEVAIIDDGSEQNQRIEDLINNFRFKINLTRIEKEEKTWVEPLALINKTIMACQSEIIILQSAECFHVGDVILRVLETIKNKMYLAFACLDLSIEWSKKIREVNNEKIFSVLPPSLFEARYPAIGIQWHNHSLLHPSPYPFCAAMTKEDYVDVGGFDEAFANGYTASDDDLLDRIKQYGIKLEIIDSPFVIHQAHTGFFLMKPNHKELREKNLKLWMEKRRERGQK